jgi:hypothetical protein
MLLALLAACKNPFVQKITDNPGNGGSAAIYTVTFDKNHSDTTVWTEANPKTVAVTSPATTVGTLPTPPTRTSYTFVSWNTEPGGGGSTFTGTTPVTASITVYARWEAAPDPYTIRINLFDNEGNDAVTASPVSGQPGNEITLNYTLANRNINNALTFTGTHTAIQEVTSPGTGTRRYTINQADASAEKVITINATFFHSDKQRDTIAFANAYNETITYGDNGNLFTKAITTTGSGSGAITYTSDTTSVATVNSATGEVTIHAAGTATITATKAEDGTYAQATARYTLTVGKKSVTITGLSAADKVYDATPSVNITGTAAIDKFGADDVTITAGTASFADKNVGTNKTVTFSGYALGGAAAGNYALSAQPAATASITPKPLTIPAPGTITKVYNAETTGPVTAGVLSGVISGDTVTVTAVGTFDQADVGTGIEVTVVYTLSGADAGNYTKPANVSGTGSITKATGRTVTAPTMASRTEDSITLHAVTVQTPTYGQTVEYAYSNAATSVPASGWVSTLEFTGLNSNTNYFFFARTAENANCFQGAEAVSNAIRPRADDPARMTKINFEEPISGITYTNGANSPTITVVNDPDTANHSSEKSLQIATSSGESYNQAAVIPIYLPYALDNYESVSFRFRLISGTESDLTNGRAINVYAAANTSTFTRYSFGNPASNGSQQFAANLVATTPGQGTAGVGFGNSYQNVWTDYELALTPSNQTMKDLQGNIFIAIGINHQNQATYMFDDITFLLKDGFVRPASIDPTTATYFKDPSNTTGHVAIPVTMKFNDATALTSITNGSTPLVENTDYTKSGDIVTLPISYLDTLPAGTATLTFNFDKGAAPTIAIQIIPVGATGLKIKYDFANGDTVPSGYPKYYSSQPTDLATTFSAGPVTSTSGVGSSSSYFGKSILLVTKTSGHSSPRFVLPFNLGAGNALSGYSKIEIMVRAIDGDLTNTKTWHLRVGTTASGTSLGSYNTSFGGSFPSGGQADFSKVTIPISSAGSYTNDVDLGFEVNNTSAFRYEVASIELIP